MARIIQLEKCTNLLNVILVSISNKPDYKRPTPMLIDKHEADNILKRIPGLTIKMSPELAAIDQVLDDDELFRMIRDDLAQRYPNTLTCRSEVDAGGGHSAYAGHQTPIRLEL